MKTSIVIPILYFNKYSEQAIKYLSHLPQYNNICFFFVVNINSENKLRDIVNGMTNEYHILSTEKKTSNELRKMAQFAKTEYIYYHDCDDTADYKFIDSFSDTIPDDKMVYVFNVTKVEINEQGDELKRTDIYESPEGIIDNIQYLSQNVYSKFIPTKLIKDIDFPNVPFTQDWAISYSLYLLAPHTFSKRSTYTYYFYPSSSSKSRYDTKTRLLRVTAYSKSIVSKFHALKLHKEADFLRIIYDIVISNRFSKIGIRYKISLPSLSTFFFMIPQRKKSFIYRYLLFLKSCFTTKI